MSEEINNTIKLGDMEIPFKVETTTSNDGLDIKIYDNKKLYVKEGVSLTNNGVLKIDYDSENDVFDFGWLKTEVTENNVTVDKILPGKISRWTKADADLKTNFASLQQDFNYHIKDEEMHLGIEDRENFNTLSSILSMVSLGYSDENETLVYSIPNLTYGDTDPYKSFYFNPMNDFSFNTFKLRMPQYDTLSGKVYVRVHRLKSSYDKSGEILGISHKPFKVYSTTTSEGYFEWTFGSTLHIRNDDHILFTFHNIKYPEDGVNDEVYIKTNSSYVDMPQCYIVTSDSGERLFNAPDFVLTNKQPNCIYFK